MRNVHLYLLSAFCLSSAVLAAPTKSQTGSFKIRRRRISPRSLGGGAAEVGKAYRKYGFDVPAALGNKTSTTNSLALGDSGDQTGEGGNGDGDGDGNGDDDAGNIPAGTEEGDVAFLAPITVGGQSLMMNFDTGSSDTWMFSTQLPADQLAQGQTVFDPAKSSTFKPLEGASWQITYGDKSTAAGTVGLDTVDIGGAKVQGQAVELATKVSSSFLRQTNSDGLVGLAFPKLNTVKPQQVKTFFQNVLPTLDLPVFTANLRHHELGAYEFGKIDESQFVGPLTYTPVDPVDGFWQVESKSFAVGNGKTQTNPNATPGVMDTGTTLILADDAVVQAYWSQVAGAQLSEDQGGFIFPCNTKLPDFHVALGPTYMATIPGDLMNFQRIGTGTCFGGMQSNNGGDHQIYGDIVFKAQFVVFNGGNNSCGFAPHK
ncbi:MAG: hypothetical protein Q9168_006668 [Polycauliona sp. 1 TL-2023]